MPCEQRQHVIEEPDAGRDFVASRAVEIQCQLNLSFSGIASDRCRTIHGQSVIQPIVAELLKGTVCEDLDFSRNPHRFKRAQFCAAANPSSSEVIDSVKLGSVRSIILVTIRTIITPASRAAR